MSDDMSNDEKRLFGLIESFGIDDGELDGITRNSCFVLGYEFASICHRGDGSHPFECYVHAENISRVQKALRKRGRRFVIKPCGEDSSESWWWLNVEKRAFVDEAQQ